jgi:2-polyprenyl-3-methyl-5-hydroxy-6-metoxy-1,4-benzoquinol methylase
MTALPEPAAVYDDAYFGGPLAEWHRRSLPTFAAFLSAALAGRPPGRTLDLGCGDGAYAAVLRPRSRELVGCDGAAAALERAGSRGLYDRLLAVDLETARREELVADGGGYDLVFCTEVVEHLADPARLFRLAADLLAPGGRLVLTTTGFHFYLFYYLAFVRPARWGHLADWLAGWVAERRADRFVERLWQVTGGHRSAFSRRRLARLARQAGLTVETLRHANVQPVAPVEHLAAAPGAGAAARLGWRALAGVGRLANAACRRTGLYGANLMLVAERPGQRPADGASAR